MSPVLVFVFVFSLIYFLQRRYKILVTGMSICGPWAIPFVGNVQMIRKLKPHYLFLVITEHRAKFRQSYRLWLGTQLWVFLHTPAETRAALNDPTLIKADTFNQLSTLIGNGLLISHGKFWETHRRALDPAFHSSVLYGFTNTISQHADILIEKLRATGAASLEVSEYLFPCILDTIIDTSMGKKLNSQSDTNSIYTHAFHQTSELLFKRMVNPLLAPDFIFKRTNLSRQLAQSVQVIHQLMETVIEERAALLRLQSQAATTTTATALKSTGSEYDISENIWDSIAGKRHTLLDTLLTTRIDGKPLTFAEIRDEVNTFVFAGVDTTTAAMSFVLYALAKHPAEQCKILEELRGIRGDSAADPTEPLTIADLNRLEYLDIFIKECLRLYTIVPMTGRQTTTDTKIGERQYCAGITIWINMYGLAHDEEYFPEPYAFRPERFARKQTYKMPAFSYLPFSGGPHVCIGRKYALLIMKILTLKIVENFEVVLSKPDEELILMAQMVLKSLNGINLYFKKRDN